VLALVGAGVSTPLAYPVVGGVVGVVTLTWLWAQAEVSKAQMANASRLFI
jgi:hypothetical protein